MKSCKCSKTGVHRVLGKVLRSAAPTKIQRKKAKMMKKVKLEVIVKMSKT